MSNNLRRLRKDQGLSQTALAKEAHRQTSLISAVEVYDWPASAESKQKIAEALKVPVSAIWPEEVEQQVGEEGSSKLGEQKDE